MKVDRRNFFGLGAGAAIAGPQAVSEVAKKIVEGGGNKFVGGSLGYAIEGASTRISTAFHVTRKGFEAVKRNGEKLGPDEERTMKAREAEAA